MKADLHIHTTASDGRLTPTEVINQAIEAGLSYIAITDHDTVDGIIALGGMSNTRINIITGIEFSTDLPGREVHILGYFIDIQNELLNHQLMILKNSRFNRIHEMIQKLSELGYYLEYEHIKKIAGQSVSIGRPHVAKALVEKKYFTTIADVFDSLLKKDGPAYVPHYKLTPYQVSDLIKQAGGIAILAHPGLINDDNLVRELIAHSIDGIEVYHPSHTEDQTDQYLNIAKQHNLIVTGGSDFHAIPGRFPEKLGIFYVDTAIAIRLSKIAKMGRH